MSAFLMELGIIILIATMLGFIAKILKQPLILAYIITGIIVGPFALNLIQSYDLMHTFSQLGAAFLLFLVGLHLSSKVMHEVGKISVITGVGQVVFTSLVGYLIALLFGFAHLEALYIAIALTFSSTIIIVKVLSDKNDLDTLYGKISIGFLLVQDFIAIGILILLSSIGPYVTLDKLIYTTLVKVGILFGITLVFGKFIFPRLFEKIARTQELLFMSGVTWLLALASFSYFFGFSIEIGAFLAGVSLASTPYSYDLGNKIKPLRDFFLVMFFVFLGTQMIFTTSALLIPAIVFSLFVLIGNPVIVLILMGLMGYKKRTGFLAGLTVAQISEFSLILMAMGLTLGHVSSGAVSMVTIVGIVTITVSTYMIHHGQRLYGLFSGILSIFERKHLREHYYFRHHKKYDFILIGHHRMGYSVMKGLLKYKTMVVDFNPTVIKNLIKKGIPSLYGDITDSEIIESIRSFDPKLIISTVPTFEENMLLINAFKNSGDDRTIFVTANHVKDALDLYKAGADYVVFPQVLGGEKVSNLIEEFNKKDFKDIEADKNFHINELKEFKDVSKFNF